MCLCGEKKKQASKYTNTLYIRQHLRYIAYILLLDAGLTLYVYFASRHSAWNWTAAMSFVNVARQKCTNNDECCGWQRFQINFYKCEQELLSYIWFAEWTGFAASFMAQLNEDVNNEQFRRTPQFVAHFWEFQEGWVSLTFKNFRMARNGSFHGFLVGNTKMLSKLNIPEAIRVILEFSSAIFSKCISLRYS